VALSVSDAESGAVAWRRALLSGVAGCIATALGLAFEWDASLVGVGAACAAACTALFFKRAPVAAVSPTTIQQNVSTGPSLSALIEALPEAALLIDSSLIIREANRAAQTLFGLRLQGSDARQMLRNPAIMRALLDCRATGQPTQSDGVLLGATDRSYTSHISRVAWTQPHLLVILQDMTSVRLTERMRVDFVANASHELRTPLSTLMGFIETLQGPAANDAEARIRFLDIMAGEASRMARLIDDLLSLSRVEMNKHVPPSTPLDLPVLLKDVGKTLAMRLEADQRTINLALPPSCPPVIGDRDQILQILHNLVSNAVKYGRTGTPIRVGLEPLEQNSTPHAVRISVQDEGEGIASEHIPRLTERFYRVDTARSRTLGGTGLGLAIVKHIVERHRGTLSIESVVGQGTTVSFTLPVATPKSIDLAARAAQA
jgi:two-component system, OmpR family, phosphate regulon sensor histidine kinase PhoR